MKKVAEKKKILKIFFIVGAVVVGMVLAKFFPLEKNHLASDMKRSQEVTETSVADSSDEFSDNKASELAYSEKVNQKIDNQAFSNRLSMKLLLQTDKRWKDLSYGSGNVEGNTLELNGCAIVSLTMVASYLDQKDYVPQDILNWAKEDYYSEGEGTKWLIFSDFALEKQYQFENLGDDIQQVKDHLQQKRPVIVSVRPGLFTETGHIMVLTGFDDGMFWINDPNDSQEKRHAERQFQEEELLADAVNFWSFYKE